MFRRVVGMLAFIIGAAVFLYFTWAAIRVGHYALIEREWPRPSPYPDRWLLALNDYYDAKYPSPPGSIKMHGELPRVRHHLALASYLGAIVCITGLAMLFLPAIVRRLRSHDNGFEVIVKGDDGPGMAS